ncbi:MAG: hypothetical protein VB074_00815 [Proteiniphilum sp.]|nr:hypothetical protein [Proteiniphilum sp.]MEA5126702.1 hypothetical protein [Proteiniphilum sp.]
MHVFLLCDLPHGTLYAAPHVREWKGIQRYAGVWLIMGNPGESGTSYKD